MFDRSQNFSTGFETAQKKRIYQALCLIYSTKERNCLTMTKETYEKLKSAGFTLFETKNFVIYGLFSDKAPEKYKKVLHYVPATIKRKEFSK